MKKFCNQCKEDVSLSTTTCPHCGGGGFSLPRPRLLKRLFRSVFKSGRRKAAALFLGLSCVYTSAAQEGSGKDTLCFVQQERGHYDDGYEAYDYVLKATVRIYLDGERVTAELWGTEETPEGEVIGEVDFWYEGRRVRDTFYLKQYTYDAAGEIEGGEDTFWALLDGNLHKFADAKTGGPMSVYSNVACE